ncbi:glycosyltransferase [Pseudobutyrivibrio ruminis]|uniref:glycosyltransferase n=1 Tax=Pseudobutyrivibrio ruminis TaxID=46206 RepID=UPI0003F98F0C|nr:glycosyltransferase [Pseudobutyrivibrio ruminis]
MKSIAIITPCILPVPAVNGGAVEELVTHLINTNETSKEMAIDLYSIANNSYSNFSYTNTNIIQIFPTNIDITTDRFIDIFNRRFFSNSFRIIDMEIARAFKNRLETLEKEYDAVIVENQMSTALEIMQIRNDGYSFPIYFHMHNDIDVYRSPQYCKQLAAGGVQFIAVSNYIKSQILKHAPRAMVHVLYNGVDFSKYTLVELNDNKPIHFLYAGRVISEKGVLELVKAFDKVTADATLDIIGFSNRPTRYEKKILSLAKKSSKKIKCKKRIATSQMAEKYSDYDVVVMPTISEEPFGLVALETIAKGMPLITTNSGALPEVVGDMALVIDKNKDFIHNLTCAMDDLASDFGKREQLGKKCQNLAKKMVEFNIDSYYDSLVSFLGNTNLEDKLVSIIVPVYNIAEFLSRCIDSILAQTHSSIELILVDDGSTDESSQICDAYGRKDKRIKVIHQPNQGLSSARNAGLDIASGDYVFFVDGDDSIEPTTIENLLLVSDNTKADVVACGFSHVGDGYFNGDEAEKRFTSDKPGIWDGVDAVVQMMTTNNVCTVAWNKLYKRNLFEGVRYPVGKLHEDEFTTHKLLYKSKIVTYVPHMYYKYYQRYKGIMSEALINRYSDYLDAIMDRMDYFKENGENSLVEYSRITLLEYIKYVYRNTKDKDLRRHLNREYKFLLDDGVPKVAGSKKRIALWLWNYIKY